MSRTVVGPSQTIQEQIETSGISGVSMYVLLTKQCFALHTIRIGTAIRKRNRSPIPSCVVFWLCSGFAVVIVMCQCHHHRCPMRCHHHIEDRAMVPGGECLDGGQEHCRRPDHTCTYVNEVVYASSRSRCQCVFQLPNIVYRLTRRS